MFHLPLPEGVVVALIGAAGLITGHIFARRTSREHTVLTVLQAEVKSLWERVRDQERRIDELVKAHQDERAKSWAAVEYCRTLLAHIRALNEFLPPDMNPPEVPTVPPELESDL